ncbi:MAG: hypothetical protein KJ630_01310 [Proteobacteria bacterium]|nr:hypothetical protein [Pseudomonadota bacterium]
MKGQNLAVKHPVQQPQVIKRPAIILCSKTIATCPFDASCISIDDETNRKTICGHYAGSVTTKEGSQVYCEFIK